MELGDRVLEVGPGFGATTRRLADRTTSLTVLELDLRYCRKLSAELGDRVEVTQGDATEMPYPDGHFSAVLCFTMLHHIGSPQLQDRLLAEAARVLDARRDIRRHRFGRRLAEVQAAARRRHVDADRARRLPGAVDAARA